MSIFGPVGGHTEEDASARRTADDSDARNDFTATSTEAVGDGNPNISDRLLGAITLQAESCGFAVDVESRRMVAVLRRQLRVWAALRRTVAAHTQRLVVLRDADLGRLELLLAPGLAAAQQLAGSAFDASDVGAKASNAAAAAIPPVLAVAGSRAVAPLVGAPLNSLVGPTPPSGSMSTSASPRRLLATAAGSTVTSQSRFS
jgi:hypothetical protein